MLTTLRATFPFAAMTLLPVPVLLAGALVGGVWIWAAALMLTVGVALADHLALRARLALPGVLSEAEFPAGDALSVTLALLHLPVLAAGAAAVGGLTGLGLAERAAAVFGFGIWHGQVGAANAHELIHRGSRRLFGLGRLVFVSLLFGHHVSAHRLVHHVHVATDRDPNSARRGEGVYRFLLRSWVGSFRAGHAAERARAAGAGRRGTPYRLYLGGAAAMLAAAALAGGWAGGAEGAARAVCGLLVLCLYAQGQVLVSDYVQHYGLRRGAEPDGRAEPVGPAHSWNAPHPVSSALMLHAARHSDHHAHPARPWPALRLPPRTEAPHLPASLPVMGIVALVPPLFRRLMHRRLPR